MSHGLALVCIPPSFTALARFSVSSALCSADLIFGNDARNILQGNGGNDRIWMRDGDDMIFGGSGDDELHDGGGKDVLHGGGGIDALFGGSGADTFHFSNPAYSLPGAEDTIHDFVSGTDYLDFVGMPLLEEHFH